MFAYLADDGAAAMDRSHLDAVVSARDLLLRWAVQRADKARLLAGVLRCR